MIARVTSTLRPISIAFLIDFNDREALDEAIRINSYLWGGAYNAIIPVYRRIPSSYKNDFFRMNSLEIIEGYIKNYDPDFIVNLSSFDIEELKNRGGDKDWTVVTKTDILYKDGSLTIPSIGIGLGEILAHLEDKEFKYIRINPVPVYDIKMPKGHRRFYSSVFGEIDPVEWNELVKRFGKNLGMKPLQINKDNYLDVLGDDGWFIRRLTDYYPERSLADCPASSYVMYMDANNWHDIVDYINLRATGVNILPVIKQGISDDKIERIKDYLGSNVGKDEDLKDTPSLLKARSINEDDFTLFVDKILKSHPSKDYPQFTEQYYPRLWDSAGVGTNINLSKQSAAGVSYLEQSFSTDNIEVRLTKPSFKLDGIDTKYQFANDININAFGADSYYAEVLAETKEPASAILESYKYGQWRISQRGATYISSSWERDQEAVELNIPKAEKIFASWYKNQNNIDIELSTPGKIAKQMLKKLGGPYEIGVLSNEGIIRLIQETVGDGSSAPTLTTHKLLSELNKIANKSKMGDGRSLLSRLLSIGALELGVEIQCPHCGKHNWYPLKKLDNDLVCDKCLDEYGIPKGNPKKDLVWAYSLVGPFRLPKMADGAYTTLLSLYFLNKIAHFSITPHLSFQKPKDTDVEADFGLLIRDRGFQSHRVSSALGECKSFKGEFEVKDVNKMKRMAKELDDPILIFATLKDKLSSREKKRLNRLLISQRKAWLKNGDKSRLMILTGNELFNELLGPKDHCEDLNKIIRRIGTNSLDSLCDATQQLYIGSQSYSDWLSQAFEQKKK